MQVQQVYRFDNPQQAYRFLNSLKNWSVKQVRAKYFDNNQSVQVSYSVSNQGFDDTASELDDLAASYEGRESS